MGATNMKRPKGLSNREWVKQNLLMAGQTILDCTTLPTSGEWQRVFYAAVREDNSGDVWALVLLMHFGGGYYNFTYKALDDTVGPCETSCPKRIIDLLTPTDSKYASEWRQQCLANQPTRKSARGDIIEFQAPLRFGNGAEVTRFRVEARGRLTALPEGWSFAARIPGWQRMPYTVAAD